MSEPIPALYNELRIQQAANKELLKILRSEMESTVKQIDALNGHLKTIQDKAVKTFDDLQLQAELIDAIVLRLNPDMP